MDKSCRKLMAFSIFVLGYAAYTIINLGLEIYAGGVFDNAAIPEGSPENILGITKTFVMIVAALMILPQIYVGIKGIRVARDPDSSFGHIFWAAVLFLFTVIGIISSVSDIMKSGSGGANFSTVIDSVIEAVFYLEFIIYAIKVRGGY